MPHSNFHEAIRENRPPSVADEAAILRELAEQQQRSKELLVELQRVCQRMHELNTESALQKAS
jgi:hypothetical protein